MARLLAILVGDLGNCTPERYIFQTLRETKIGKSAHDLQQIVRVRIILPWVTERLQSIRHLYLLNFVLKVF